MEDLQVSVDEALDRLDEMDDQINELERLVNDLRVQVANKRDK